MSVRALPPAKVLTGIPGFDTLTYGGLSANRSTLISGSSGSGKTIFAVQFLARGITELGEHGVFVTFEESPDDIRRNVASFGWDLAAWEEEGKWAFVDASPDPEEEIVEAGEYDLGGVMARIQHAIGRTSAKRLAVDSLSAVFSQFQDASVVRNELFRIARSARKMGVTAVLTAERTEEYGPVGRYGVEEFIADNVVVLRNVLDEEQRRRTLELLKFRGTDHQKGEHPFVIEADRGLVVIPLTGIPLEQRSSNVRVTSGNPDLDAMCGGGFFRDSVVLVSGATDGVLRVHCEYPEARGLQDHLLRIKRMIEEIAPQRVVLDSLSALERVGPPKAFRQMVIDLTSFIKQKSITGLFTNTTPTLVGGTSVTEAHISSLTDSIILLRYVEMFGEMQRGLMVLKMRGSPHEKEIRQVTIDATGMHLGEPFRSVSGILSGNPMPSREELARLEGLFPPE